MSNTFVERQRENRSIIETLYEKRDHVIIIHYSCESIYDSDNGKSPKITSIACRSLNTGQTQSFSIQQFSELPEFAGKDIWENFEGIEKLMLDAFFEYVAQKVDSHYWVHWNMRDIGFGFAAIEHRYTVLRGNPIKIPDDRKFDLARIFVGLYGKRYASHPRLKTIMEVNQVATRDFLTGKDEAYAFKDREFLKLHRSTLRKSDVIANLLERSVDGTLKSQSSFWDRNGGSLRLIWEKYVTTPWGAGTAFLLTVTGVLEVFAPGAVQKVLSKVLSYLGLTQSGTP